MSDGVFVGRYYDRRIKCPVRRSKWNQRGCAQIFWKRQETAKWSSDLKSSVWGAGKIPHFSFFFPTRKVSNPRLHLTVSCRFLNSSGIKISSLSSSNGCTPLA